MSAGPTTLLSVILPLVTLMPPTVLRAQSADDAAAKFIREYEHDVRPLEKAVALAWWNANTTGSDAEFQKKEAAQNQLDQALADKERFAALKVVREGRPKDPQLARQVQLLYLAFLEKQVDPALLKQMTAKANAVEKAFNVYRCRMPAREGVAGKELSENEVREILKQGQDPAQRKAAWEGSKGVGVVVEKDLLELVRLRNQAAKALGFADYHKMMLALNEQDQGEVLKLFDELDTLTRAPFLAMKQEIDARLAAGHGIKPVELRPWHYHDPFFQEPPSVFGMDLDSVYQKADILKLCREFYAGIGLPIEDVIGRSDLYEKPGKSPHAFCTDIDREGDVRVLGNIKPNDYWASTMLHELGHSVYSSKNIPQSLPYLLRTEAHILTTEGVAMMFERLTKKAAWLTGMGFPVPDQKAFDETGARQVRNQLLTFSRWCQVMLRFEKELYANPQQDLNQLWWDLVERYQGLTRPDGRNAPDFASKIHIVSAPAYYHNYMMGQLFASQVHHAIVREVYPGKMPEDVVYVGNKKVGEFMNRKVFGPGRTLPWNELTKAATGEPLNAKAFAADFKSR
jgi:peptidyl-dipeptidase A